MRDVLTSDVIAALLAHLPRESEQSSDAEFEGNPGQIHAAFNQVAQRYPELLGDISFGRPGTFVRSPAIAGALDTLVMDGFLSCANPDLVMYSIKGDKLSRYYHDYLESRFERDDVTVQLGDAAVLFQETLARLRDSDNAWELLVDA